MDRDGEASERRTLYGVRQKQEFHGCRVQFGISISYQRAGLGMCVWDLEEISRLEE